MSRTRAYQNWYIRRWCMLSVRWKMIATLVRFFGVMWFINCVGIVLKCRRFCCCCFVFVFLRGTAWEHMFSQQTNWWHRRKRRRRKKNACDARYFRFPVRFFFLTRRAFCWSTNIFGVECFCVCRFLCYKCYLCALYTCLPRPATKKTHPFRWNSHRYSQYSSCRQSAMFPDILAESAWICQRFINSDETHRNRSTHMCMWVVVCVCA